MFKEEEHAGGDAPRFDNAKTAKIGPARLEYWIHIATRAAHGVPASKSPPGYPYDGLGRQRQPQSIGAMPHHHLESHHHLETHARFTHKRK